MSTHDIDTGLPYVAFCRVSDIDPHESHYSQLGVSADTRLYTEDQVLAAIEADRKRTAELLKNPVHVHTNMCRGIIAPITFDILAHVLGEEATQAWLNDRKTYNPIGEGTIQQLHDVLLCLQNETMKLEAAYGSNFKKEATEKARAATEKMNEAVYAIKNIDRKRRGEPVAWLYEDELPDNYPYDTMFPYSKVDGVRMFPVDAPQPAEPAREPGNDERAAQGLPPYSPRHMTEEEWNRLTESGRRAWGKQPAVPEKEPPCET